jgi:hypothetical protein
MMLRMNAVRGMKSIIIKSFNIFKKSVYFHSQSAGSSSVSFVGALWLSWMTNVFMSVLGRCLWLGGWWMSHACEKETTVALLFTFIS